MLVTRLSPAMTSSISEAARPSEMDGVAKRARAASTTDSGPRSSSMSTSRSSASSASCTTQMKANICSLGKLIRKQRRRKAPVPTEKDRPYDRRRTEAVAHLVDGYVELLGPQLVEREPELAAAVREVRHRDPDERDPPELDHRHRLHEKLAGREEDRLRVRRRVGKRARAGRARRVVEAQAQDHGSTQALRGSHASGHAVDERDQGGFDFWERRLLPAESPLRADRPAPPAPLHRPRVAVVRECEQVPAGRASEHRRERLLGKLGDLSD